MAPQCRVWTWIVHLGHEILFRSATHPIRANRATMDLNGLFTQSLIPRREHTNDSLVRWVHISTLPHFPRLVNLNRSFYLAYHPPPICRLSDILTIGGSVRVSLRQYHRPSR